MAGPTEEPVIISALNQYGYCPRRCALIHLEQTFQENVYTVRGSNLHERADQPESSEWEEGVRVERGLPLWSRRLGLIGKADVVEFHGEMPYPVEYKSGRRRQYENDDLQLCAQALCLEEMLQVAVPKGAIYHHGSRRRREVEFDEGLRYRVEESIAAIRAMLGSGRAPPPVNDARCDHCSLKDACMPSVVGEGERVRRLGMTLFNPTEG